MMVVFTLSPIKKIITYGLAAVTLCLFCVSSVCAEVTLKHVMVDSRFMKFPKIPLDGIKYASLTFEHGVKGSVEIKQIHEKTELAKCGTAHYLLVDYLGPAIVFRIFDGSRKKVLLRKNIDTNGSSEFGREGCKSLSDVKENFEENRDGWQAQLNKKLLSDARSEMNAFINKDTALEYEDVRFPLFFVSSEGTKHNRINQGFDRARKAFDLYQRFGVTIDAQATLREVVSEWEQQLEDLKYRRNTSPEDRGVMRILHRNLSITYFFLTDFNASRKHDAMAISKGMPQDESLQPLILKHERRYIFSPKVANNLVLMANLYRFGSNVITGAILQEASFDSL